MRQMFVVQLTITVHLLQLQNIFLYYKIDWLKLVLHCVLSAVFAVTLYEITIKYWSNFITDYSNLTLNIKENDNILLAL